MLRLQGFPDTFKITIPYSQARKVAGNSVSVPVIEAIAGEMMKALNSKRKAIKAPIQLTLLEPAYYEHYRRQAVVG
jgi:DNA (cytosine-5)-methyltransferase 1